MGTSVFHHVGGDGALFILPELDPSSVRSSPPFLLSVPLIISLPLSQSSNHNTGATAYLSIV